MQPQTILIEQTAKPIKRAELITLLTLFASIVAGLVLMYVWLPLSLTMFIFAVLSFLGFIAVRIHRWWLHG